MRRIIITIVLLGLVAGVGSALACGESRFRTGHGLRFQGYQAPMPASVLVFAAPSDRLSMELDLRRLSSAGHQVLVVHDPEQLSQELERRHVDVLITSEQGLASAEAGVDGARVRPELLPVIASGEEAVALRARYPRTLELGEGVRGLLSALDEVMQTRARLVGANR